MKATLFAIALPGALMLSLGCERISAPQSAQVRSLPIPTLISRAALPRPFSSTTYFLYDARWNLGVDSLLSEVLHKDIPILDGWYPKTALCMAALPDFLIVQLAAPDRRIEALGFTRDSTRAGVECVAAFLHYDFRGTPVTR